MAAGGARAGIARRAGLAAARARPPPAAGPRRSGGKGRAGSPEGPRPPAARSPAPCCLPAAPSERKAAAPRRPFIPGPATSSGSARGGSAPAQPGPAEQGAGHTGGPALARRQRERRHSASARTSHLFIELYFPSVGQGTRARLLLWRRRGAGRGAGPPGPGDPPRQHRHHPRRAEHSTAPETDTGTASPADRVGGSPPSRLLNSQVTTYSTGRPSAGLFCDTNDSLSSSPAKRRPGARCRRRRAQVPGRPPRLHRTPSTRPPGSAPPQTFSVYKRDTRNILNKVGVFLFVFLKFSSTVTNYILS